MNEFLCSFSSVIRWAWLRSTERMTYLYHRRERVFGKDGLDLLSWIMILLILHNSITSWAGAAKITEHQATAVTPKVFSKKKLENSGETKTPKGDKYEEVSWPYPCYHFYPGLFHWSCRALSPDRALMLWWVSMGTAVPWPRWHWHIWASALVPQALRGLGTLAGPDPQSVGFDHLFILSR